MTMSEAHEVHLVGGRLARAQRLRKSAADALLATQQWADAFRADNRAGAMRYSPE
jgi:hypothetical protein